MPVFTTAGLLLQAGGTTGLEVSARLGIQPASLSQAFAGKTPPHPKLYDVIADLTDEATAQAIRESVEERRAEYLASRSWQPRKREEANR